VTDTDEAWRNHPYTPGRGARPGSFTPPAAVADCGPRGPVWRAAIQLFDAGFYWEAHERLEAIWNAHGRRGPSAVLMRGLIALCAAAVKRRQGRLQRVAALCARARGCFAEASGEIPRWRLDPLRLDRCVADLARAEPAEPATVLHAQPVGPA
jgi:hypothetical protein